MRRSLVSIRWSEHALANLAAREIDLSHALAAIEHPDLTVDEPPGRRVAMRRYLDPVLGREMLLRVVLEEAATETVVVTLYKTSNIRKYLQGHVR
ncbi:MAG: DUF4258 domain-containing protein [Anaerolineae bacterium]